MAVTAAELRQRRFAAQNLHRARPAQPAEIVHDVLAVQAQDLRSARLAVRARSAGLDASGVDNALRDGSVIVSWLMRGTLHLVHRDDYAWLWALTSPTTIAANRRRLGQEGVPPADAEKALAVIVESLANHGPLPRAELAQRIEHAGVRTEGQATPHLLLLAALRGLIVLGPIQDGTHAFVLTRDWLGGEPTPLAPEDRPRAVADLVRRYLRGHGPATAADIATWSGVGLRDVRAGIADIAGELSEDGDLIDLSRRAAPPGDLPARLLPAFDPYLLGWRDRSFAVPDEHRRRVFPGGGMLRATAIADGRAVATWTMRRRAGTLTVEIDAFDPLDEATANALRAESDDVVRFERR